MKKLILLTLLMLVLSGCGNEYLLKQDGDKTCLAEGTESSGEYISCIDNSLKETTSDVKFLMEQSGYVRLKPQKSCGGDTKCKNKEYSNNPLEIEFFNDIGCDNHGLSSVEEDRCRELKKELNLCGFYNADLCVDSEDEVTIIQASEIIKIEY